MTQRTVESVIGRLVTDEDFRRRFKANQAALLDELIAAGAQLTPVERQALLQTDLEDCERFADRLPPQLQKICLRSQTHE